MKKLLLLLLFCLPLATFADDGMWFLPMMQQQGLEKKLKKAGLKIKLSEIYSETAPSLRDCIGQFGGGCTGEIVSHDGLVFTNHHCGFSFVHEMSTDENNYTRDGFFAKSREEELPVPELTFTFVLEMRDVTEAVKSRAKKEGIDVYQMQSARYLKKMAQEIEATETATEKYRGKKGLHFVIEPLFSSNRFYLTVYQTYYDVRLVANPPYQVAQFGGNSDNWIWPRQNVDFAVFRIYADKNGQPAEYSKNNVPLHREKALTLSLRQLREGDFTMIMGFPGSTDRYASSAEVNMAINYSNIPFIKIGEPILRYYESIMNKSDSLRLIYEGDYFNLANGVKYKGGETASCHREKMVEKKQKIDEEVRNWARLHHRADVLAALDTLQAVCDESSVALREAYTAVLATRALHCKAFAALLKEYQAAVSGNQEENIQKTKAWLLAEGEKYAGTFAHEFDRGLLLTILPLVLNNLETDLTNADALRRALNGRSTDAFVEDAFHTTLFMHPDSLAAALERNDLSALENDPLVGLLKNLSINPASPSFPALATSDERLLGAQYLYTQALCEMRGWQEAPDATFTLRFTYGKVCDLWPRDAVHYAATSHATGMIEKISETNSDYFANASFVKALESGRYGDYAAPDGTLPACFLSNNDITGGNSGSPVLDAYGHLVGLAFDGNIESLSSNFAFHPALQRCINVDIRYVLFTLLEYGGSTYLKDELTIVKK